MGISIKKNDSDVRDLSAASSAMLETIIAKYHLNNSVCLFETLHGHIAKLTSKEGRFIPGTEGQPARVDKNDFEFLSALPGFRWVEFATDNIKIGFQNLPGSNDSKSSTTDAETKFVRVGEFRNLIYRLQRLFNVDRHACVGDKEKFTWQLMTERVLAELQQTESKRAKAEDKNDKLKICTAVSTYLLNNKISKPV